MLLSYVITENELLATNTPPHSSLPDLGPAVYLFANPAAASQFSVAAGSMVVSQMLVPQNRILHADKSLSEQDPEVFKMLASLVDDLDLPSPTPTMKAMELIEQCVAAFNSHPGHHAKLRVNQALRQKGIDLVSHRCITESDSADALLAVLNPMIINPINQPVTQRSVH